MTENFHKICHIYAKILHTHLQNVCLSVHSTFHYVVWQACCELAANIFSFTFSSPGLPELKSYFSLRGRSGAWILAGTRLHGILKSGENITIFEKEKKQQQQQQKKHTLKKKFQKLEWPTPIQSIPLLDDDNDEGLSCWGPCLADGACYWWLHRGDAVLVLVLPRPFSPLPLSRIWVLEI